MEGIPFRVQHHPGKVFRGLHVHVLVIPGVGKLGPEGDVQRQGQIQGPVHLPVGQDGHGRGAQAAGDLGPRTVIRFVMRIHLIH